MYEREAYDVIYRLLTEDRVDPLDLAVQIGSAFSDAGRYESGLGREAEPFRATNMQKLAGLLGGWE